MSTHIPLYLKPEQRLALENLLRSGHPAARTQTRARILLLTDRSLGEARTDEQIAQVLLCSNATVASIRKRFLNEGLDAALYDKPRPGPAPKFTGAMEAQLTVLACSDPPEGYARWTVSLLTEKVVALEIIDQISRSTIGERLKKNEIKPWQVKSWVIGQPSASYVAKREDVLDVYARPYDPKRPVVCMDEGGKELRDTPHGTIPMEPGQPAREDYEYERHGKANLFLSVEPLAGRRRVQVTERHTACDFAA